jgi:hypothetical protein
VDLEEEDIDEVTPEVVTKRMVWRVAQAQYEPLGLITPFLIQFKLVMRSICSEEGKVTGWDEEISDSAVVAFKRAMSGLRELKKISFQRSIQPSKRPVEPTPASDGWGWLQRSLFNTSLHQVGPGGWVSGMQTNCWKIKSGSQAEDFYTKNGAHGSTIDRQTGQEDSRLVHIQI